MKPEFSINSEIWNLGALQENSSHDCLLLESDGFLKFEEMVKGVFRTPHNPIAQVKLTLEPCGTIN